MHFSTPSSTWTRIFGGKAADKLNSKFSDRNFRMPENFDTVEDKLGIRFAAGQNDWENSWTAISASDSSDRMVWFTIAFDEEEHPGKENLSEDVRKKNDKRVREILDNWIKAAVKYRDAQFPDSDNKKLSVAYLAGGLSEIVDDIEKYGISQKKLVPLKKDSFNDEMDQV